MRTIALALALILSFMIPWEGVIRVAGLGNGTKIMGYVLTAFWLVTVLYSGQMRKPGPLQVSLSLFVLWCAVSIFWSADPGETIAHVMTWVQLIILVTIWWDLFTTRTAILSGLQAYVLGAYVAVGGAISNFFSGSSYYTYYDRFSPGETNPDGFGFLMVLGIPMAWYLGATIKTTGRMGSLLRLINYAYFPMAMLGIALSGTRTALIAAIPGVIFGLASLTRVRRSTRVLIFVVFMVAAFYALPRLQETRSFQRLGTTGTELTEGDLNNRTNNWREGLDSFIEHPFVGVGSRMYRSVNSLGKVAHNTYLSVLVEVGLVGLTLFVLILTLAVRQAWSLPKWDRNFWLTLLVVWAIGASTLTWEHRKSTWLLFSLLAANAALTSQREEEVSAVQGDEVMGRFARQTG